MPDRPTVLTTHDSAPVLDPKSARPQFGPNRWLRGGHVQTIASFLLPRRVTLLPPEAWLITVAPGIQVRCLCYWQQNRQAALTLIAVHGLEGSTDSQYMLGVTRNGL